MNESFFAILPSELAAGLRRIPAAQRAAMQEIHLRCAQRATYLDEAGEHIIPAGLDGFLVDSACLQALVNRATGYCTYAASAQLRQGFLSLPGGHRLGLCGQAVLEAGQVRTIRNLSSINLRIARQLTGDGAQVLAVLSRFPSSTLIAGPPGCGKTTLLRTLIAAISDDFRQRVGIVDERQELAACTGGVPGFKVGSRTDVLSGVPKHEGVYMLLRTMNPDWIAVDEITQDRDVDALLRSSFCGVRILATAHVFCRADLNARPLYARMLALGLFDHLILMDKQHRIKMERMNSNDKTAGRSTNYSLGGVCGIPDGAWGQDGGGAAAAAFAGAGADEM